MSPWEERFPRLWAVGEWLAVLIVGGLLFYLFSALIVTIPAAVVGLYAAVAALIRPVEGESVGRFWRGFRRTFGRALLLGLLNLAAGAILWFDFRFFWAMGGTLPRVAAMVFASLGFVLVMANVYAWPLLAWYPQPLGKLLRRAGLLAAAHPFHALGAIVSSAGALVALSFLPGALKAFLVMLGPGLVVLITGYFAWLAMKRYAGPEDEFAE